MAQNWTCEGGSYWLDDLVVESTNEKCNICGQVYDPEVGHECETKCQYCGTNVKDIDYHYRTSLSCANAAGYGSDKKDADENDDTQGTDNGGGTTQELPNVTVTGNQGGSNSGIWSISLTPVEEGTTGFLTEVDTETENPADTVAIGALPTSGRISISNFLSLMKYGVHIANLNIPKEFHEQTLKYECVVRGIANIAQIMGKDYDVAYQVLSKIASDAGYNLKDDGILDRNVHKLFNNYVTLSRNICTEAFIENQIDTHNNVLVSIWTEDGPHMVTVLGYDNYSYYCAAGFKDVDIISKGFLDTARSAFIVKQFNGAYK